jgi:hypothetical protein
VAVVVAGKNKEKKNKKETANLLSPSPLLSQKKKN